MIDSRSGWATPPAAARLAGDEIYRAFDDLTSAMEFLRQSTCAAERQRRARARRRRQEIVAPVAIGCGVLDTLLTLGWLDEPDALDRGRIGDAVGRLLMDLASNTEIYRRA